MKINVLGGGPAGLYVALLLKQATPSHEISVIERNPAGATYGWGVVFSDRTLSSLREADHKSYTEITDRFVTWGSIDTYYRDQCITCGGHLFAGMERRRLLAILQARCREVGVALSFEREVDDVAALAEECDLLIAADGVNSRTRALFQGTFAPRIEPGHARYIWLGTDRVLDAFTFIFRENEHGLFQVHAYPFSATTSTFIVECDEETWQRAGLPDASEEQSIAYCQRLFAPELRGCRLMGNRSAWISFQTVSCAKWRHENVVLLGDASHTAHFSIGSGTKLAMEDAIALADAIERHGDDIAAACNDYEAERRPAVEGLQRAARESQRYFETIRRHTNLPPLPFTFHLLSRSGRVSYDDLRLRDERFVAEVDRWYAGSAEAVWSGAPARLGLGSADLLAPPPAFEPVTIGALALRNRLAYRVGVPGSASDAEIVSASVAQVGAGLLLTPALAVSAAGRLSPGDASLYKPEHMLCWQQFVAQAHDHNARVAAVLGHAGRRGAVLPASVGRGIDRPLPPGDAWPLLAPSAIPYTARSQVPEVMDETALERTRDEFVEAACHAAHAGVDLLLLDMAGGHLLASFLSPLTNQRSDGYGGQLAARARYPLEVFDAVRATWPAERPFGVALVVDDCQRGGLAADDGVALARMLVEHGCAIIQACAGHTTPAGHPSYGPGYLSGYADRVRNEAGTPVLVSGYLTGVNAANTVIASGRADIALLEALGSTSA